jgi:hypothetical protein
MINANWCVSRLRAFVSRLLPVALLIAVAPAAALAEGPRVGGHIGLATPLVTIPSEGDTTYISDQFTLVMPIGVTVKLSDRLAVDFETQVANPVDPEGTTALVVAPGLVYNFGAFAGGLRVASEIGAPSNIGLIPLINKGIAPVGAGTWFVEAAFPTFVRSKSPDFTFTVVVHTGIGF